MTDLSNGAASGGPADDLRSALSAAIGSRDGDRPEEMANGAAAEPDAPSDTVGDDAAAAPADRAEINQSAGEGEPPPSGPGALDPPSNWSDADKDLFKTLPDAARKFLLDRHRAMEADHTRKTQSIAELKREYEPVEEIFAPYREVMRQRGLTSRALIEGWADVERRLADGDGVNVIKGIVSGYNIDPARVADAPPRRRFL